MQLNREKFWQLYHKSFDAYGRTTQKTVDALNYILDRFENETRLKNIGQFSYCLATWFHETGIDGNHFVPVREKKARAGTEVWRKYQSKYWGTGFFGRGLDQTTFEENYRKAGKDLGLGDLFVQNPDLLLKIEYAYDVAVSGMATGRYRADKSKRRYSLGRFLKSDDCSLQEYWDARNIVNGDKNRVVDGKANGLRIAEIAEKFEHILARSQAPTSAAVSTEQGRANPVAGEPPDAVIPTEHPAGTQEQPPITEQTVVEQKNDTLVSTTTANVQDIHQPAVVDGVKPYNEIGLQDTLKGDAKAILPANLGLNTFSEVIQQTTGWPPWVAALIPKLVIAALLCTVVWLLYRLASWLMHNWRENERVKLLAQINSDPTRKDLQLQ